MEESDLRALFLWPINPKLCQLPGMFTVIQRRRSNPNVTPTTTTVTWVAHRQYHLFYDAAVSVSCEAHQLFIESKTT